MQVAVLVPVKRFTAAKGRLRGVIPDDDRAQLAQWMAEQVLTACAGLECFVACDDDDVRSWAETRGATVTWGPELGLNRAVDDGVATIAERGFDHVIVSHADLPLPVALPTIARAGTITLVPDRRLDGTNVMSFPTDHRVAASYGGGSFRRHLAAAQVLGHSIEVRRDHHLSLDLDTVEDLHHPLVEEVLPPWLRTNPANPAD
ncbi:MAG: 2-phospho-L-lactate guanylyltransferase [Actinomycetota bacterium]